jgi:hypothetical protein
MPTNYGPTATLRPAKGLKLVYLIARREKTYLCSFRNPAIYDCVQLGVQILRDKLSNQSGEGWRELGRFEHTGIACRDGSHLRPPQLNIILGSDGLVPRGEVPETRGN